MATELLPMAASVLKNLPAAAQFIRDVTTVSPTQAAAQNTVVSRAYVEESLSRLDIVPNLLKAQQSMYAGMILMILQRSNEIAAGRTVSDTLNKVYTRGMGVEAYRDIEEELSAITTSVENLRPSNESFLSTTTQAGLEDDNKEGREGDSSGSLKIDTLGGTIAPPDLLPVGQMLKVSLIGRDNNGNAIKNDVLIGVRMTPYIVTDRAMEVIIAQGYQPSFKMRWMQWKAGEISFWKDLVFQADRIRKMEEAARTDRTGAYRSFIQDTARRDKDRALDILYNLPTPQSMSNNLANSVIIVSEETVRRAAADSGFDITDTSARQKFFKGSYVMMLAIVDPNYHHVTLYMNGYDTPQQYAFTDFSPKKKMDAADFMQAFSAASSTTRPVGRF